MGNWIVEIDDGSAGWLLDPRMAMFLAPEIIQHGSGGRSTRDDWARPNHDLTRDAM